MWEKISERQGPFWKNCAAYERLGLTSKKIYKTKFPDMMVVRIGTRSIHYHDERSSHRFALFLKKKGKRYISKIFLKGEQKIKRLKVFSEFKNLHGLTDKELLKITRSFFDHYHNYYPYYIASVFVDLMDEESIHKMGELRLLTKTESTKIDKKAEKLLKEIARRVHWDPQDFLYLRPDEIVSLIEGKHINKKIILKRQKCYIVLKDGKCRLVENKLPRLEKIKTKKITGVGTYPAKFKGMVKIVSNFKDMKKLKPKDILVTNMTMPNMIIPIFSKLSGIITDEGGVTCHAAVISREFKIPALIGTKNATKLLKDGDLVKVDTKKGIAVKCKK